MWQTLLVKWKLRFNLSTYIFVPLGFFGRQYSLTGDTRPTAAGIDVPACYSDWAFAGVVSLVLRPAAVATPGANNDRDPVINGITIALSSACWALHLNGSNTLQAL